MVLGKPSFKKKIYFAKKFHKRGGHLVFIPLFFKKTQKTPKRPPKDSQKTPKRPQKDPKKTPKRPPKNAPKITPKKIDFHKTPTGVTVL
jgi:hypothetical protein